jgi:hypothetical protein
MPVVVDQTGWIYVKFLDCTSGLSGLSQMNSVRSSKPSVDMLLSRIKINRFNLFVEQFKFRTKLPDNRATPCDQEKYILYVQIDLSQCEVLPSHADNEKLLMDMDTQIKRLDEIGLTVLKTHELAKLYACEDKTPSKVNFAYIFKVVSKSSIYSMANSRYKSKLRGDLQVEIRPHDSRNTYSKTSVLLALVSNALYFYNFMHEGDYYELRSNEMLQVPFKNSPAILFPQEIIFINENMQIIHRPQYVDNNSPNALKRINPEHSNRLSGILIQKSFINANLSPPGFCVDSDLSISLMNHFEIIFPNREFKMIVKRTDDRHESASSQHPNIIVYFNSKFSLHELCVLPGMHVCFHNLVKKSDSVYKSLGTVSVLFEQNFNLLRLPMAIREHEGDTTCNNEKQAELATTLSKRKTIFETLNQLDLIYNDIYLKNQHCWEKKTRQGLSSNKIDELDEKSEASTAAYKLKLLFKNSLFGIDNKLFGDNSSKLTILAQIVKIYDLKLCLKCRHCNLVKSLCKCELQAATATLTTNSYRIEIYMTFLIDDHTSLLRLSYFNADYDLNSPQSNLFNHVGALVSSILYKHLHEIRMPVSVPHSFDSSSRVEERLEKELDSEKDQNESELTINALESTINCSSATKKQLIDVYKTLHEYLLNCVLYKYYLFCIDAQEARLDADDMKKSILSKLENSLFKLDQINEKKQFMSVLRAKCVSFLTVESAFDNSYP